MKALKKNIEEWIRPFATIVGEGVNVDESLKKSNPMKYFLHLTIPNQFEKYAIAFHSFWINPKVPTNEIKESHNDDEEIDEDEYNRVTWKDYFLMKGKDFTLEQAFHNSEEFYKQFKQMNNELFPGEGLFDKEHILSIINTASDIYGNQDIEAFYVFLATHDLEENKLYECKLSELENLLTERNLRLTPSLIYSKDRKWIVNTDYDLPFSAIGGEGKFIDKLVRENNGEIYELKY